MRLAFLTHEPYFPPSGGGSAEAIYLIRELVRRGHEVHLFARRGNKVNGKVNPFIYFGRPKFAGWAGEAPIEVKWDLPAPVPQELWAELGVPEVI
jgi:hypothetical protein